MEGAIGGEGECGDEVKVYC